MFEVDCFLISLANERVGDGTRCSKRYDLVRADDGTILVSDVCGIYSHGPKVPPPGSMWWRTNEARPGEVPLPWSLDASLVVMTEFGVWSIDERAADCDKPRDTAHRCWPRRGRPPLITVDKRFDSSCGADPAARCGDNRAWLTNGRLRMAAG